jgi:hypothetical protein
MNDSEQHSHAPISDSLDKNTLRTEHIKLLNDLFRITGLGGRQVFTPGIRALGLLAMIELRLRIAEFHAFTPDNDPHGEHDFGSLAFLGETVFWKIDYYDETLSWGSPDPADPAVTTRLLTIMLASEY